MRKTVAVLYVAIFTTALLQAQAITLQPVMTNATVEAMVRGGVPLATVIQAIKTAPAVDFLIDSYGVGQLSKAGAPDRAADQIMDAMHQRTAHGPVAATPTPATSKAVTRAHEGREVPGRGDPTDLRPSVPTLTAIPVPLATTATIAPKEPVLEPEFVEVFFRLDRGSLTPLERQGAIVKARVNGFIVMSMKGMLDIPGETSPVRFRSGEPLEFVVRSPGVVSATDPVGLYHMRRLSPKKHIRETLVSGGHASPLGASMNTGRTDGLIPLEFEHYGSASYKIRPAQLVPGEYAIGRTGGKTLFCFGID